MKPGRCRDVLRPSTSLQAGTKTDACDGCIIANISKQCGRCPKDFTGVPGAPTSKPVVYKEFPTIWQALRRMQMEFKVVIKFVAVAAGCKHSKGHMNIGHALLEAISRV